jgi:alkylated DNA repair dioxygenase AlkB
MDISDFLQDNRNKVVDLKFVPVNKIPGLYICDDIIDQDFELNLLHQINQEKWLSELSRRVQHYGYKYDYKKHLIDKNDYLGELPVWSNVISNNISKLMEKSCIQLPYKKFDQMIINEYKTRQGISPHRDCIPCFQDGIASVTIGCNGIMTFAKCESNSNDDDEEKHHILLKRRSVVLLTGESRYKWTHAVIPAKNKIFTESNPRISLTFRKIID